MFDNDSIKVTITYGSPVSFSLRMINLAEENALRQKAFGLSEEEKAEKEYSSNVSILADLADKMPEGLFPNRPEAVSEDDQTLYFEEFKTPRGMIEAFFDTKTAIKERIAFYAVRSYFLRLSPSDFF